MKREGRQWPARWPQLRLPLERVRKPHRTDRVGALDLTARVVRQEHRARVAGALQSLLGQPEVGREVREQRLQIQVVQAVGRSAPEGHIGVRRQGHIGVSRQVHRPRGPHLRRRWIKLLALHRAVLCHGEHLPNDANEPDKPDGHKHPERLRWSAAAGAGRWRPHERKLLTTDGAWRERGTCFPFLSTAARRTASPSLERGQHGQLAKVWARLAVV